MKITALIENISDEYGGPANSLPSFLYNINLYENVSSRIFSVSLKDGEKNELINKFRLGWESYPVTGPKKIMYSKGLRNAVFQYARTSDLIMSNNLWNYPSYLGYILSRKLCIPHVISVRGSLYPWSLSQSKWLKKAAWFSFQKRALNSASLVHVTCKEELEAVRALGIDTPIALVPHGIDVKPLPREFDRSSVCEAMGLDPNRRYFLFMSRLHKKKGLDVLLNVWTKIASSHPDWSLLIVGPDYGGYEKRISELVRRDSSLNRSIKSLGMKTGEDKESLFALSDFFVLPSHSENFGVVVGEAMAAGLPVITTNGTPWKVIEETGCGIYTSPHEAAIEKSLVEFLSQSPTQLSQRGRTAREVIIKDYSWECQVAKFRQALDYLKSGVGTDVISLKS